MAGLSMISWRPRNLLGVVVLACTSPALAVHPGFAKAEAFGFELQRRYAEVKSEAIISHLDSDRLFQRVFAPLGGNASEDRDTRRVWHENLFPAVTRELRQLDVMPTLMFSRVLLLGDGRYLETLLFSKEGRFNILWLRLAENADGTVVFEDFQISGTLLEFSQATRCMLLLLGTTWYRPLAEEEMLLGRLSGSVRRSTIQLLNAIGQKHLDEAYRIWLHAPEALRETRYWRGLRTQLAGIGCQAAAIDLREACRSGIESDAVLRLSILGGAAENQEQALLLVEDAMRTHFDLPYFRVVRAEALLAAQRPEEALREVKEVMQLNPYCLPAYLIGVQAALILDRPTLIPPILSQWVTVVPVKAMEEVMNAITPTAQYLKSKAYAEWRETQVKTPALAK